MRRKISPLERFRQELMGSVAGASLSGYNVLYFFVDGMYVKLLHDREEKQPVLIAYGILWDGRKVLLHVGVGDRESYEACLGFLPNMTERGLRVPLLNCSDDCPGLSLIYAVTVDVAKRWRGIRIRPLDLETLNVLRGEIAPRKASE